MRFLKPLDTNLLKEALENCHNIITIEDGVRNGGFGSCILEYISDNGFTNRVIRLGLPDSFVEHGTVGELQHLVGIDVENIVNTIKSICL